MESLRRWVRTQARNGWNPARLQPGQSPNAFSELSCKQYYNPESQVPAFSPAGWEEPALASLSIFFRRLRGRISVHTSLMYSRHSALGPLLPASLQPNGFGRWSGQIEYCSSWL